VQNYVVYECYAENIRFDVAKTCAAAHVPFAIVTNCLASPSFSCYNGRCAKRRDPPPPDCTERIKYSLNLMEACDTCPAVLVMDPVSALYFLRLRLGLQTSTVGDVFLFDEPTTCVSAEVSRMHAELLGVLPAITVLMSATLDERASLTSICDDMAQRFGTQPQLADVTSQRIVSPCTVVDANGTVFGPHRLFGRCTGALLRCSQERLHILRLWSPRALLQFLQDFEAAQVSARTLAPLQAYSFAGVREAAMTVLASLPDNTPLPCAAAGYQVLSVQELCTNRAHVFPGTSFLLGENVQTLTAELLQPLFDVRPERLSARLRLRDMEEARRRVVRTHEGATRSGKERVSALDRQRADAEAALVRDSLELWPPWLCVNTHAHVKRFAPNAAFSPTLFRQVPLVPEDILRHSCEELVEGLLCGVSVLQSPLGDASFGLASQTLAEEKAFSMIVGGRAAIFGVNLPCDRVMLALEAKGMKQEMLVQSLGRCGRTGKYSQSEVVFASLDLIHLLFN
jgi:hypothetical protein